MFALNQDKLEYVKSLHKSILAKRKSEDVRQNRQLIEAAAKKPRVPPYVVDRERREIPIVPPEEARNVSCTMIRPSRSVTIPYMKLSNIETKPERLHFTPTQVNIEVEDEHVLHHMPYIGTEGSDDDEFYESLIDAYDGKLHHLQDMPLTIEIIVQLVQSLKDVKINNSPQIRRSQPTVPKETRTLRNKAASDYQSGCSDGQKIVFNEDEIFEYIAFLSQDKEDEPLTTEEVRGKYRNHISTQNERETMPNIDEPMDKIYSAEQALDTHMKLYCPRCLINDCLQHAIPERVREPVNNMPLTKICGPDCFLNLDTVKADDFLSHDENEENPESHGDFPQLKEASIRNIELSFQLKTLLNVYMSTFERNYCAMAHLMTYEGDYTCAEIFVEAKRIKKAMGVNDFESSLVKHCEKKKKSNVKKQSKTSSVWRNFEKKTPDEDRKQYTPCNHPGVPCSEAEKCSCVQNGTSCEKFCNCSDDCPKKFPGCRCKGSCQTNQCPCFFANRECDGDRCKCTVDVINAEHLKCKNCAIQRGLGKHLLMSPSEVAGWGVYLNGTAKKNDLISEYCGEMISHAEADVRGIVYDKTGVSFLFDVNSDRLCDSKDFGNKIRFANHCSDNPNCHAKIMLVNGSHRIGIYASRTINQFEELFFNYGKVKFNPAPRGTTTNFHNV